MPPTEPCMFQMAHCPMAARAGHFSACPPTVPPRPADPHAPLGHVQLHLAMPDRSCTKVEVGGDGCSVASVGCSKLCSRERESVTAIVLGIAKVACGPYSFKDIAKRTQFGDMTGPRDNQSAEALRSLGRFGPHSDSTPVTDTDWWRDILVSRPVRSIVSSSDHR